MFALLLQAAFAANKEDPSEEIIVYGDDFARWDNTRWLVQTELMLPLGVLFGSEQNISFLTYAFQIRSVIGCEKDAKLSKRRWEVSCTIEDIGIRTTTFRDWRRQGERDRVQRVLDEIDAKLTGLEVQMQVDSEGGVNNFDLEGLVNDNTRERTIQESLRQVIGRTMAGFHLRIPDHAQRGGQWVEYRSELMDIPSLTASRGTSTLVHLVSPFKNDLQLVQTMGEGAASINLPSFSREAFSTSNFSEIASSMSGNSSQGSGGSSGASGGLGAASGPTAAAPSTDFQTPSTTTGSETDIEATYKMEANGVAVFRKADGIMTERVWAVVGTPTASSGGGTMTAPFVNRGRIQLLGKDDHPDVGPSMQVAWPSRQMEGLEPWISIEELK